MKKIFSAFLLLTACSLCSCEKEMMDYEGTESIYFSVRRQNESWLNDEKGFSFWDYTDIEFLRKDGDHFDQVLKVAVKGLPVDFPRPFSITAAPETTGVEGEDYEFLQTEYTIEPGMLSTEITVRVFRTPRMQNENVEVAIQLLPNEYFNMNYKVFEQPVELRTWNYQEELDNTKHTLIVNDLVAEPSRWHGGVDEYGFETERFGLYSQKKFAIVRELSGTNISDWWDSNKITAGHQYFCVAVVSRYLIEEYKKGPEYALLEDDGRLMWFGEVPWKTRVGTVWDKSTWPDDLNE